MPPQNDLLSHPLDYFFFLMRHEMWILAVLVLFHCSVPPPELVIGASMSYSWDSSSLFKERGPLMLFTWEQVSKCQFLVIHISCQNWNVSPIHHAGSNKVFRIKYIWVLMKSTIWTLQISFVRGMSHVWLLSIGKVQMIFTHVCKWECKWNCLWALSTIKKEKWVPH